MGILTRLRQRRLWLALVAIAGGLTCLTVAVNGRCPLLPAQLGADAATVVPPAGCCPICLPHPAAVRAPVPVPPVQNRVCCATFKAFLPLGAGAPKFKAASLLGGPPPDSTAPGPLDCRRSSVRAAVPDARSGLPGVAAPPPVFLRLVIRRCHPGLAPPATAVALLS